MPTGTFFGHRDCPEAIKLRLREILVDMITNHGVDMFYVGHQGQFDAYVHSELKRLKQEYPLFRKRAINLGKKKVVINL